MGQKGMFFYSRTFCYKEVTFCVLLLKIKLSSIALS